MTNETEITVLQFAGYLTQLYLETINCLIGNGATNESIRREMLMRVRDAELAKVDAIERQLDISPTTADIRKQYKENNRDILHKKGA